MKNTCNVINMSLRRKVKSHKPSIKVVSNSIDKNWSYDSEIQKFSHPIYPNQLFGAVCRNTEKVKVETYIDKFGKKTKKTSKVIISELFPLIPTDEDPRNLGYNIVSNSFSDFDVIPNKMNSFWDTRRGKRYIKYVTYRKSRDANRKLWLEENKQNDDKNN